MRAALLLLGAAVCLAAAAAQEVQGDRTLMATRCRYWRHVLQRCPSWTTTTRRPRPRECHQCYTIVSEAVYRIREQLNKLDELLRGVGSDISATQTAEFLQQKFILKANIKALLNDAERAINRDGSSLLTLGDLQERIAELRKAAGTLLIYIGQASRESDQCSNTTIQLETLLNQLDASLRDALNYVEINGQEALLRAIEQMKQFDRQSSRMSDIAREARWLADQHEEEAASINILVEKAVSNSTAAYDLANTLLELQRNYSLEINLLSSNLNSTELLVLRTRNEAAEVLRQASEAYENALNLYSAVTTGFESLDVISLKNRADYIKAEAQRLKADLERLTDQHRPMMNSLETTTNSLSILIERGTSQQMLANNLMTDATAARDKARQAVTDGEKTLAEAQKMLQTLRGFDRQVQESRQEAYAALEQVTFIVQMVEEAEWRTRQATLALQGANRNASAARDTATEAESVADEAFKKATSILEQTVVTSERATALRQETRRIEVSVTEQTDIIGNYESQLKVDAALAREAKEKAGLAGDNARTAQRQVEAALKTVRDIMALLEATGDLDLATLAELERRLSDAENQLNDAELITRMTEFKDHRVYQEGQVKNYQAELNYLHSEVNNMEEIINTLPDGCFNRITLEP